MLIDNEWVWDDIDEQLITAGLDCSSHRNVVLRFQHRLRQDGENSADVDVCVGEGAWRTVRRFPASETPGIVADVAGAVEIDLASIADGQRDVRIRWRCDVYSVWFWGIDDVELRGTYVPDDPDTRPRDPHPPDDAQAVDVESKLTWTPRPGAAAHRVSFSTDFSVANDPNNGQPCGDAQFDPGPLQLDTTYCWRVDESWGSQWYKSGVWSFTTVDTIVIDDFESYTNQAPNRVFMTWRDRYDAIIEEWGFLTGNGTGATVGYDPVAGDIMERDIVHGGLQSMPLFYDNTTSDEQLPYSQTEAIFGQRASWWDTEPLKTPQNWAGHGAKFLSFWFHGEPNNAPEQLYLGLEDSRKHLKIVDYPGGPAAVRIAQWRQWCIDLQELATGGVDLGDIRRIIIGLGNPGNPTPGGKGLIYIDDIRLHPRVCPVSWSFTSLAPGERVEVSYQSQGCFHWYDYSLIFQRDKEPTMTAYGIGYDSQSKEIGTLTLSRDDLTGLDKLIDFYRSGPLGGCTTVDTVEVSVYLGDHLMAEEHFKDASCDTYFMKDVTTFNDLISRLPTGN